MPFDEQLAVRIRRVLQDGPGGVASLPALRTWVRRAVEHALQQPAKRSRARPGKTSRAAIRPAKR